MATTIFLVRHAEHELLGRVLCGRMPGVSLGEAGRQQALRLGGRLQREGLAALYTSPLARTRETAAVIGQQCGFAADIATEFEEIDFGRWTGASFDRLNPDPAWQSWNAERASGRPPGGESMAEAQARAVAGVRRIEALHPEASVAIVSHADVIKSVLAWCLGLSMDFHARFEIGPASVSAMAMWGTGAKVLWMNEAVTS
ncbi:histidine phosphatase family protein [Belnapia rosea]|uniref:Probable phosphoglycerate mutase n=1 Tax=Belnapia rosea TaxID=938405 RepID=A0A1G7D2P4_9PROT|nr:histidine phosphatase family protein [Belnapia rosea]SDE45767.1 probable phosphoglycerate mutase [Belnapia rosea]